MIRIDEIYNNTFWPWIQSKIKNKRVFFCDPPGHTGIENLFNLGEDGDDENGYLFFHDQEPLNLKAYNPLFTEVQNRNLDLYPCNYKRLINNITDDDLPKIGAIVVSELGENLEKLTQQRNWDSYYYFFHGWAALDWYRGYDKTFLREPIDIKHTFLMPNNIIGGQRKHRLELFVELEKRNLIKSNLVSFPKVCPHENISAVDLCKNYNLDIIKTKLPLILDTFDNHANNSHSLTMWKQSATSLLNLVTETAFYGNRLHLTEKTFKPIAMAQPFVLASCRGSLEYLRSYGFETFSSVWDESYDSLPDDQRIKAIGLLLEDLEHSNCREWLHEQCAPIVEHNFNHFYGGAFEKILWKELTNMLEDIQNDFCIR